MINGGLFSLSYDVTDRIEGDPTTLERDHVASLAKDGELMAYQHCGIWKPMDTLRDTNYIKEVWQTEKTPWEVCS